MKRYMKNKNFIPEKFYDKIKVNKNKMENKIFTIFLITNLILIPISAKSIGKVKEKPIENKIDINYSKSNNISSNDINIWIESIIKSDIEEAHITNNNGEILVSDLEKIDEMSSNDLIRISDVSLTDSGKYKLGVSLYE